MTAQLGSTTDPRALIPGQPEALSKDLRSTAKDAKTIHKTGKGLGGVKVKQWIGAASEAFHKALGEEPKDWLDTVERLLKAGETMAHYAEVLAKAQDEAQRAIELFTQAQAASRLAAAQYTVQTQNAVAAGRPTAEVPPFSDPGAAALKEAEEILDAARKSVSDAAWSAFDKFLDSKEQKEKKGGKSVGVPQDEAERRLHKKGYEGGLKEGPKLPIDETTIAEGQAKVDVLNGKLDGSFQSGALSGKGSIEGSLLGAGVGGSITAGPAGITAGANAEAYLYKASADGELHMGPGTAKGHAEIFDGAEADVTAHVGPTGAKVDAGAFAGVKVKGDASVSGGGVTAGVNGEAWAGVGATAHAQIGMGEDGKFHIGGSAGAALVYGGKVGYEVSFDPKELKNTVHEVAGNIDHVKDVVGHALGL